MSFDFSTFVLSVASAAMMGMGLAPHPETGKQEVNLNIAKQNIDMLEMIQQKTRNNLTKEEDFSKVLLVLPEIIERVRSAKSL